MAKKSKRSAKQKAAKATVAEAEKKSQKKATSDEKATTKAEEVKETPVTDADEVVEVEEVEENTGKDEAETADDDDDETEVVEVVEIEEPVEEKSAKSGNSSKEHLSDVKPSSMIIEAIGSFIITAVFIRLIDLKLGTGTDIGYTSHLPGQLGIALIVSVITTVFINRSGADFNPAVTLAKLINRKTSLVRALLYILAQVLGAVLALLVLTGVNNFSYNYDTALQKAALSAGVTQDTIDKAGGFDKWAKQVGGKSYIAQQLGVTKSAPELSKYSTLASGKEWAALLAEIIGAFILGTGAAYAYKNREKHVVAAGLAIGFSLLAGLVIAGNTAILNPAIASTMGVFTFSKPVPAIWSIVVYILGPICGTTLGFLAYNGLTKDEA